MAKEITIPTWLLQDQSISPEMLFVYAKVKAKVVLTKADQQVCKILAAKGLISVTKQADLVIEPLKEPLKAPRTKATEIKEPSNSADSNTSGAPQSKLTTTPTKERVSDVENALEELESTIQIGKMSLISAFKLHLNSGVGAPCALKRWGPKYNTLRYIQGPNALYLTTTATSKTTTITTVKPSIIILYNNYFKILNARMLNIEYIYNQMLDKDQVSEKVSENEGQERVSENERIRETEGQEDKKSQRSISQLAKVRKKIKTFSAIDPRDFSIRWAEFKLILSQMREQHCKLVIKTYLMELLIAKALEAGIRLSIDQSEWAEQSRYIDQLYQQYTHWKLTDWQRAIDWFLNDDFWCNVIVDPKTLKKHINRFVVWQQRKEPQSKLTQIKVIGR